MHLLLKQISRSKGDEKMKDGYAGKIPNTGAAIVKAPAQVPVTKGGSVVKKGSDLRTGK